MKNYFTKTNNEEQGRKFRVHGLKHLLPSGAQISRVEEIAEFRNSKFAEVEDMKKSKFEEVEV
jgi:hypothetical protein